MKKIILFFYDSGPSDNVTNIIQKYKNKAKYYFFIYKNSPAYKIAQNKSLGNILIDISTITNIKKQIQSINPDFIYVGTSWQNKIHLDFIKYAKDLQIPSVASMDHWVNYRERFGYPQKNWEKNRPDFITVNDKYGYKIAKKFGFKNIIKLKFYTLLNDIKKLEQQTIKNKDEVLFISEPTRKVAKIHFGDEKYWGFDEFNLVETIISNLKYFKTKNIKIRLHPSDEVGKYDYLHNKFKNANITIQDPYTNPLLDSVASSKIIIGVDGFVLYVAKVFGKYSISYIPNNKRECVVPIFDRNHIKSINKNTKLSNFKKKDSIKSTKNFGISFEKFLDIVSSKKLNATIIGCGNIGGFYDTPNAKSIFTHAHAYKQNNNTKLTSCCDLDTNNIKRFKELWGKDIKGYQDIDKLLKNESIDIVSLTTSTNSHYPILKQLLKNTKIKYILCEKPFVSTMKEFNSISKLIKKSDKKLSINFIRCFDPSINKLKKLIASKELGQVISFSSQFNKGIYHNGSHILSLIEHLMGAINSIEVLNKKIYKDDIYGNFTINLNNNITGTINNFHNTDFSTLELNIILEYGYIKISKSGFDIIVYKSQQSKFKEIKQLNQYKKYPNSLDKYAKNSLDFLLNGDVDKQLKKHLSISKKLLQLKQKFFKKNNKVKF